MSFWNQQRIKNTLGGSWVARPDARPVEGVSVDTRTLREGQVFFALRGERFDAHAFLGAAIEHGAGVLVVDDAEAAAEYRSGAGGVGVLRVDDAGAALARLAGAYRQTLDSLRVVGVTGSNGKTTVVRLIDALLRTRFRGGASVKSYNNAVGVPLTVLAAKPGDQYLVCEVGMNAPPARSRRWRASPTRTSASSRPSVGPTSARSGARSRASRARRRRCCRTSGPTGSRW